MPINIEKLEKQREEASRDKADLFDFYHDNWDEVISTLKRLRETTKELDETLFPKKVVK